MTDRDVSGRLVSYLHSIGVKTVAVWMDLGKLIVFTENVNQKIPAEFEGFIVEKRQAFITD